MDRSPPRLRRATPTARRSRIAFTLLVLASSFAAVADARAQDEASRPVAETAPPDERASAPASSAGEDSIDALVWSLDAGYRTLDMRKVTFDGDGANPRLMANRSGGFSPGIGVGVRLWWITLMARADITFLASRDPYVVDDAAQLWNLDLELGWGLTLGRVRPSLLLGAGYSALGGFEDVVENVPRFGRADGANLRAGLGVTYAASRVVHVGVRGTVDVLLLASETSVGTLLAPAEVDTLGQARERLRDADGSITAFSFAPSATLSLHFF